MQLWRGVLRGRGVADQLAAGLAGRKLSRSAARAGVRACRDGGRDAPKLLAALLPLSGMSRTADQLTAAEIQRMMRQVARDGDPHHGERVYMRSELQCVNCHAIGGVGGQVGPDMTSLGASAPLDYIIESLFNPNAKIKEGFHSVTVLTAGGMVVSGIEVEGTDSELILRNAKNELVRIPRADVLETKAGKSLMPTGVIDRLPMGEQIDLISFLSRLGKPGDFDASRGGVSRVYEVFAGTHRVEQQGAERIVRGEVQDGWTPLLARVNGDVSAERLREMTRQPVNIALVHVYLRTRINVANSGEVTLEVAGPDTPAVWIDAAPVEGKGTFKSNLDAGEHTVLVRLDARELPETFRLSSPDVTFTTERP